MKSKYTIQILAIKLVKKNGSEIITSITHYLNCSSDSEIKILAKAVLVSVDGKKSQEKKK